MKQNGKATGRLGRRVAKVLTRRRLRAKNIPPRCETREERGT